MAVRGLTFEYSRLGLVLGCCQKDYGFRPTDGGYLIEGNTFRNSGNSVRAILASPEPTIIRNNTFVNAFHALSASASHFHVLDNHITVPEPERVPGMSYAGFAIALSPLPRGGNDAPGTAAPMCEHNIIAGNHIEGYVDGILFLASPGTSCRHNMVRDNTIIVRRVRHPSPWLYEALFPIADATDSTFVGVPLGLFGIAAESTDTAEAPPPAILEGNTFEGNRVIGSEGLGIELVRASRNRIVNNTISSIRRREPFPGNSPGFMADWGAANGSGIWLSPGSDENEIEGNVFEDIAADAIVLEGDGNRVVTRSAGEVVHDAGAGNRVTGPGRVRRR